MNFQKNLHDNKRGFTLVESLVAISVLTGIIVGATGAVQKAILVHTYSKDQIIAFYLAQEGIEQVRNLRDRNALSGASHWLTGISSVESDPCYFGQACIADATDGTLERCPAGAGSCENLRQDDETGLYGYSGAWDESGFKREIIITSINANEASILVTVNWSTGASEREFVARENILNWQQ